MRRSSNQDNYAIVLADDREHWEKSGHLLIVADGMGAHAAGELASRLSVDLIPHHYAKLNRGDSPQALLRAMEEANQEIYRRGQANPEFRSMGTTTCALAILPVGAVVGHVGDSRVYRLRGNVFEQLTFDHSLVWEVHASRELSQDVTWSSAIPKNVITRSLGPSSSVVVDLEGPFPLQRGDRFLLCSDGLSGQLTDEEIGILLGSLDIDLAVRAMVDLANLRGGPDNITVVIAEVVNDALLHQSTAQSDGTRISGAYPLAFGVIAAICALAGIVLLFVQQYPLAMIAAGAAIVAAASGWFKQQMSKSSASGRDQLGKGPYRKYQCKPNAEFCQQLQTVVNELKEWSRDRTDLKNWPTLETQIAAGQERLGAKDYKAAIHHFITVITTLMQDIKKRNAADDEAIDY